ncbi:MAG: protease [Firmicutes bacterium GWF2_51_9]|nr:MAG: protease [Firmicutes bacterium GWF2_51_9]OGS57655.1 MAG: protease [Firmicutes bacterium GWE2_51_13]HAM63740.1 collagenase-like protease [Erysipelotrichaceae bacterium]HBZ42413.1 collagenase-like protease [Erysipelotrichaceae bacterium]
MKPELLAPAGDLARAKTAIRFGADAVYLGGKRFSLRSRASNFELEDIAEAVRFAKEYDAKIYVTVNMVPHDEDLQGLEVYLLALEKCGVAAIIVASLHIALLSKKIAPAMEVHLSTQLSLTNSAAIETVRRFGVDRVVLAREVSLAQIETISSASSMPLEVFIHGGMCVNLSGRCTLSNEMTLRDANRGGCAQSCRWKYKLYRDQTEISDPNCLFSMSSKDLLAIEEIPTLMKQGISSFKIEGRMKSAYYITVVVDAYRKLIDAIDQGEDEKEAIEKARKMLMKAENRPTSDGFFRTIPGATHHLYGVNGEGITQDFVANVIETHPNGRTSILIRNNLPVHTELDVLSPGNDVRSFTLEAMYRKGEAIEVANLPMEVLDIEIPFRVESGDFIRKKGS